MASKKQKKSAKKAPVINSAQARREAAAAAIDAEQRTMRRVLFAVLGVILALVLFVVGYAVVAQFGLDEEAAKKNSELAASADNYTISYGDAKAKAVVDVYFDFMCPGCGQMERANSAELSQLAKDGTAYIKYHPMNFEDERSKGTKFSTRAANAFVAVGLNDPEKALLLADKIWQNQPAQNTEGLTDEQIATYAAEVGVPQEVIATFTDLKYEEWVTTSWKASIASGIRSTPGVRINGEIVSGGEANPTVDVYNPGPLGAAIKKAANG